VSKEITKLSPLIKQAHPNFLNLTYIGHRAPNDTHFPRQWALERIGASNAWDISTGSPNVVIAIIDSGCDMNHEDLSAKFVPARDRLNVMNGTNDPSDIFGHGTCLVGIASAESNNAKGIAGVDWNCKIMPLKIYEDLSNPWTDELTAAKAITWAVEHGANVINMSWGWPAPHDNIASALYRAFQEKVVLVASAGNYLRDEVQSPVEFPASHRFVIAVGASDQDDKRKSLTSRSQECLEASLETVWM
jgi:thermitase